VRRQPSGREGSIVSTPSCPSSPSACLAGGERAGVDGVQARRLSRRGGGGGFATAGSGEGGGGGGVAAGAPEGCVTAQSTATTGDRHPPRPPSSSPTPSRCIAARELADIASDQASAAAALMKDREDEIGELAEQLRSYAGRTDEDAIIGKLQARARNCNDQPPPLPPPSSRSCHDVCLGVLTCAGGGADAEKQLPRLPAQARRSAPLSTADTGSHDGVRSGGRSAGWRGADGCVVLVMHNAHDRMHSPSPLPLSFPSPYRPCLWCVQCGRMDG